MCENEPFQVIFEQYLQIFEFDVVWSFSLVTTVGGEPAASICTAGTALYKIILLPPWSFVSQAGFDLHVNVEPLLYLKWHVWAFFNVDDSELHGVWGCAKLIVAHLPKDDFHFTRSFTTIFTRARLLFLPTLSQTISIHGSLYCALICF